MLKFIQDFLDIERLKGFSESTVTKKGKYLERFFDYTDTVLGKKYYQIIESDIVRYLDFFKETSSGALHNIVLSVLKQFFRYLMEAEEIFINPAMNLKGVKLKKTEPTSVFSEHAVKQIMESTKETPVGRRDRAILELFYSTGLRLSELVNLDIDDIDFRHREIRVRRAKFDKERMVPVGSEALKSLEEYLKERFELCEYDSEALFLSTRKQRISTNAVRTIIERRKEDAGILVKGKATALRHSCATHLLKRGAPLQILKRLLGHESLESTEIYTRVKDKDLVGKFKEAKGGSDE